MLKKALILLFIMILNIPLFSADRWREYDRIIAVVNDTPLVASEIEERYKYLISHGKLKKRGNAGRSEILDSFIHKAIIRQVAEKESIIVSDTKVAERFKYYMKSLFSKKVKKGELDKTIDAIAERIVKSRQKNAIIQPNPQYDALMEFFIKTVEKKNRMSFNQFFEETRMAIMRELVMSIAVGTEPPSEKDVKKWYYRHKRKLGLEVNVQHILIRPKGRSFAAERKANKIIGALLKRANRGESFDKLARKYSQDKASSYKGGRLGWKMLQEFDPYFANAVYQMKRVGSISRVFKSRSGYHIVKLLGKKPVSFDKVKQLITMKLFNENMLRKYKKWIEEKRRKSDVIIHMAHYVK